MSDIKSVWSRRKCPYCPSELKNARALHSHKHNLHPEKIAVKKKRKR